MKQAQVLRMASWTKCHICVWAITNLLIQKHSFPRDILLLSVPISEPSPLLLVLILSHIPSNLAPSLLRTLCCQLHYHQRASSIFSAPFSPCLSPPSALCLISTFLHPPYLRTSAGPFFDPRRRAVLKQFLLNGG